MHRRQEKWKAPLRAGAAAALAACTLGALAQGAPPAGGLASLKQAFDVAWSRQPEAQVLQVRRDAARAQGRAAQAWTPEPPALGAAGKSDRLNRNEGAREIELGLAIPLWLPGERERSAALAGAEGQAVESGAGAAQLRVAEAVRTAWWSWQRERIEVDTGRIQLDSAQRIAADVARRVQAGELSRADRHQADGAVAAAEAALAQAEAGAVAAQQLLRASTGETPTAAVASLLAEPEPTGAAAQLAEAAAQESHAALLALKDRVAVAERMAELAATQSRANPELALLATRERGNDGENYRHTVTLGMRIPFGGGARHEARVASARADATEMQVQLALERDRLAAQRSAALARVEAARARLAAADRRAVLARESRGFFDKAFRLGEADLPTRLRIEAEADEAQRQAARARIELSAAISSWRQALGLLPE